MATGYRVDRGGSWKDFRYTAGQLVVEAEVLAAGLPAAVIAVWVGQRAWVAVELPDPPKVASPESSPLET